MHNMSTCSHGLLRSLTWCAGGVERWGSGLTRCAAAATGGLPHTGWLRESCIRKEDRSQCMLPQLLCSLTWSAGGVERWGSGLTGCAAANGGLPHTGWLRESCIRKEDRSQCMLPRVIMFTDLECWRCGETGKWAHKMCCSCHWWPAPHCQLAQGELQGKELPV